jgi:hypothetical protein
MGMNICFAQEYDKTGKEKEKRSYVIYNVFFNIVPEWFNFPLIGFVNVAEGSHNSAQIGFVNWNQKNFNGPQISFVNTIGGSTNGVQLGFINTNVQSLNGSQIGFINTTFGEELKGVQIGFVNTTFGEELKGSQIGFVNTSPNKTTGVQVSFVNVTKKLHGLQLGFVNYADEIEGGIPIGFISYVKNGGYKAVEYSVSEISPVNAVLKLGIEKFYTSLHFSYNPLKDDFPSAGGAGLGLGSLFYIKKSFFFNPELAVIGTFEKNNGQYISFIPYFGYKILPHFSIVAGPSITWIRGTDGIESPFFQIIGKKINENNQLFLGARLGLRFEW